MILKTNSGIINTNAGRQDSRVYTEITKAKGHRNFDSMVFGSARMTFPLFALFPSHAHGFLR
ncbi:hypothetical protein SLEP1_g4209 [Rubroshorea leprosula]|uniref:Uncharacterized protein n=1 Tax=Rubroshorea leprosula TaxID=152421 RepID=A0AAV5HSA8_9ROSI|nr:hypothetical protein SLEP1_g4209 [Rubroshorea leprosula]